MVSIVNHYEAAFGQWLSENRLQHIGVDQTRKRWFARDRIKTFDFLVYPPTGTLLLAEIKGRIFGGRTLRNLSGLQNWVTREDVRGLLQWQQAFQKDDPDAMGLLVFAYDLRQIDPDADGTEIFETGGRRYAFFGIRLDDYARHMTVRSPRWQTVMLPIEPFRRLAKPIRDWLV
jgi:hypothetical protein